MDFDIQSWHELYEQNDQLENMIIIYQKEIQHLQEENRALKEKIRLLEQKNKSVLEDIKVTECLNN